MMAETGTEMSSSPKQFTGHARDPKRKDRPHRHTRTHTPGQMEGPWKIQTLPGSGREQNGRENNTEEPLLPLAGNPPAGRTSELTAECSIGGTTFATVPTTHTTVNGEQNHHEQMVNRITMNKPRWRRT